MLKLKMMLKLKTVLSGTGFKFGTIDKIWQYVVHSYLNEEKSRQFMWLNIIFGNQIRGAGRWDLV